MQRTIPTRAATIGGIALAALLLPRLPAAADSGCRSESFADSAYTVCSFDPSRDDIRIYWRDEAGTPYRTFPALADALAASGLALAFAMNGGMYQDNLAPVGLLVVDGVVKKKANTIDLAPGTDPVPNFYKKPNGVFFVGGGTAGVLDTGAYLKADPKPDFATQSGPMLVIDGEIHPAFIAGSLYLKPRNGVGVSSPTEVHFVISEEPVNFDEFARFFRDRLGCSNALFLDGGSAPGIYAPGLGRNDPPSHGGYGPIVAIVGEKP